MDYGLAKQLKDAGYPQGVGRFVGPDWNGGGDEQSLSRAGMNGGAYVATLSELIEACGEGFGALARIGQFPYSTLLRNRFVAWGHDRSIQAGAETPEEAVARLWLALNPKTDDNHA